MKAHALPYLVIALPLLACGGQEFVAGASDAAPSDAASADAGPGFCASQPAGLALCSDFDEKPLPESWNDLLTKGGPPVSEDDGASVSPPNSLLATAPALAANAAPTQAFVTATTALPLGAVHIAFDLRIDALSFPTGPAGATVVPALYTQGKYEILLAFAPSTTASPFSFVLVELSAPLVTALDAGANTTFHDLTPLFAQASDGGSGLGSWQTIKMDLDIDHGTKTASISVGSATTIVTLSPPPGTANGARSFTLGIQATGPTNATKLRFDDVTYSN